MANWSSIVCGICSEASGSGSIPLKDVNTMMRTFAVLDEGAASAAQATMQAVKDGSIKVTSDSSGVFTSSGMRVKGT